MSVGWSGGYWYGGYDRAQSDQFPTGIYPGPNWISGTIPPGYGTLTNFINSLSSGIYVCGGGNAANDNTDYSAKGAVGRPGVVVPPNRGQGGGAGVNGGTGLVAINVPKDYYMQWGAGLVQPHITTMTEITQYVFFGGFDGVFFHRKQ